MTVTADSKKRVVLPVAKPGDRFDLQTSLEGALVLRPLPAARSRRARVRLKKHGRFTVGVLDHPINEAAAYAQSFQFAHHY